MKPIIAVAMAALLAACTPYAQRVAKTCTSLGAVQGTPEYWNCIDQQMANDARQREMYSRMSTAGFGMLQQPAPVVVVQPRY
jgi:hypothetical protein